MVDGPRDAIREKRRVERRLAARGGAGGRGLGRTIAIGLIVAGILLVTFALMTSTIWLVWIALGVGIVVVLVLVLGGASGAAGRGPVK